MRIILVNACEQWLAAAGVDESDIETFSQPVETSEVREAVEILLSRSPAFTHLSPAMRARVARDTAYIADYLGSVRTADPFASFTKAVNFPAFVAGLIEGVFHAIVDAPS